MSEPYANMHASSAPGDWVDLRPDAATARAKTAATSRTTKLDPDAVIAFALFLTMLFIPQLDTAGAALFVLISAGYTVWRVKQLPAILAPRGFLLAIPALAVLSVLWSDEPLLTLKYSLEFVATAVIALLLSAPQQPKRVIEAIFAAFAVHVFVSLGFGQTVGVGANGETAFAGLNASKNLLADEAATGFLFTLAVFFIGIEEHKFSRCAAAVLLGIVQIYLILVARSAGAMVGLAVASAVFLFFLALRNVVFSVRVTSLGVTAICLFLTAFAYETLSDVLVDFGTRYFNKDMTFTGRTYLWERADELISERPFLGRGFHAFWIQGNPDAEGMWRYLDIKNEYGFNFHNTFVELLVHLGWLGAIVCGIVFIFGLVLLVLRFIRRPDLAVCFWLSMVAYQCVRMPIETVAPGEFSVSTMLILIPLGLALGPAPARSLSRGPAPHPRSDGLEQHYGETA